MIALSPAEKDTFKIVSAVNQLIQGKTNAAGSVTLTANAATTAVTAPTCGAGNHVFLFPKTANASAEIGAGTIYVLDANVVASQFTITHANNAQTDRTFGWLVVG